MNTKLAYTLALKQSADVEGFPCEDVFTIKANGTPLLDIHLGWSVPTLTGDPDRYAVSGRVESIKGTGYTVAEDLPFIYNGFQLIGVINQLIADQMNENTEFYSQVFYDDNGDKRELPIDFDALTR